ncbi:EAL domain-containing protein [Sphingomonas rubra]|nr:EAL domain-containing protein [Sphingomonas rubra]
MKQQQSSGPIDARGRIDAALAEVAAYQGQRQGQGRGGLLVLADTLADAERLVDAGATHFLIAPRGAGEVVLALRAAGALTERRSPEARAEGRGEAAALHRWLAGRLQAHQPCAAVAIALSRLDLVNAAHGRARADAAIATAGERIAAAAGERAIVVRTGDRFLLGVEDGDLRLLAAALSRALEVEGTRVMLGSRIGVAEAMPGDDADALIRRATDALDDARAPGAAAVQVAEADGVASPDRLAIDLHHAVAAGEIDVLFQPQVEIATGRIVGVEALARWTHGRLGPLGADALFAAADRADLGLALSDHIQELTLARAAAWPRSLGALRLSLNLTAADVARAGFARTFLDRVDASGFPRGRLTVEVTESGMIHELDHAAALLAELRGAGCRVAIDDFGTGYSSLAYLKALPLDYLKLDKALVVDIAGAPRDRVVVRGVIDIARALGIAVIAEGVETPAQLALLTAEGCGWYQGFLRAGPLGEDALVTMVEGR